MRDEFSTQVKDRLSKRVGYRCSNPACRQPTSGPQVDSTGTINVGVAAHISAAAPGGARYDEKLSSDERKSIDNGIWLCQKCAKLIDSDPVRYTTALLQALESGQNEDTNETRVFIKLEALMPDLLLEMRQDLAKYPLARDFVLLNKGASYWSGGRELNYNYEDHENLRDKIQILQNACLVTETTFTNVPRFVMQEDFVDYLQREGE